MITYVRGSIFTSPAHTLVNTVNTRGVMGKGIAKSFRDAMPAMYERYRAECQAGRFAIGDLLLYRTPNRAVLNFPTKDDWRKPSRLDYVRAGLETFVANYARFGLTSIAFPQLGCGNGGLDWSDVKSLMEHYLADLPIDTYIHLYGGDDVLPVGWVDGDIAEWLSSPTMKWTGDDLWESLLAIPLANHGSDDAEGTVERGLVDGDTMLVVHCCDSEHWICREAFAAFWSEQAASSCISQVSLEQCFGDAAKPFLRLLLRVDGAQAVSTAMPHSLDQWVPAVHLLAPKAPLVCSGGELSDDPAMEQDPKQLALLV